MRAGGGVTNADDENVVAANLLPRVGPVLPEISLVAAIFGDAVRCLQRTPRGVTHRQSLEAFEWMSSERRDWPFAFANVCEVLGVDATAVRARFGVGGEATGNRNGLHQKRLDGL